MRRVVFFLFITFAHCLHQSPLLSDANAGGKPLCSKHRCEMTGKGDQAYCEKCRQEKEGVYEPPSAIAQADCQGDQLTDQMQRIVLLGDSRWNNPAPSDRGSMTATAKAPCLQHASLDSPYSSTGTHPNIPGSTQRRAVIVPDQPTSVEPSGEVDTNPSDTLCRESDSNLHQHLFYVPPLAPIETRGLSRSMPLQPVDDTGGNPLLKKMNKALSEQEIFLRHRSSRVLPAGTELLRAHEKFITYADLQAANLEYTGGDLTCLADILKQGKVIIRVHQENGLVILLHIHADNNQAVLITDTGNSSSAVDPEYLSTLLTNTFSSETGTQIEVFLSNESVAQTQQQEMKIALDENGWQIMPEHLLVIDTPAMTVPVSTSAPIASGDGVSDLIIKYIHEQLRPKSIPGIPQHTPVMQELLDYGYNSIAVDSVMSIYSFQPLDTTTNDMSELINHHASLLVFVQNRDQSLVISVQHTEQGSVLIIVGNQQLQINSKDLKQMFDWLLSCNFQIVRIFYRTLYV